MSLTFLTRLTAPRLSPPPEPETEISDKMNHHHGQQLNKILNHLLPPPDRITWPHQSPDILTDLKNLTSLEPPQFPGFPLQVEDCINRPFDLKKVFPEELDCPIEGFVVTTQRDLTRDPRGYSIQWIIRNIMFISPDLGEVHISTACWPMSSPSLLPLSSWVMELTHLALEPGEPEVTCLMKSEFTELTSRL